MVADTCRIRQAGLLCLHTYTAGHTHLVAPEFFEYLANSNRTALNHCDNTKFYSRLLLLIAVERGGPGARARTTRAWRIEARAFRAVLRIERCTSAARGAPRRRWWWRGSGNRDARALYTRISRSRSQLMCWRLVSYLRLFKKLSFRGRIRVIFEEKVLQDDF